MIGIKYKYTWAIYGALFLFVIYIINTTAFLNVLPFDTIRHSIITSSLIGCSYIFRDFIHAHYDAQNNGRNGLIVSMLFATVGALIIYFLCDVASYFIAGSIAAYLISTLVDGLIFSFRWRETFGYRCSHSNAWAGFIDTVIFGSVILIYGGVDSLNIMNEMLKLTFKITPALVLFFFLEPSRILYTVGIGGKPRHERITDYNK